MATDTILYETICGQRVDASSLDEYYWLTSWWRKERKKHCAVLELTTDFVLNKCKMDRRRLEYEKLVNVNWIKLSCDTKTELEKSIKICIREIRRKIAFMLECMQLKGYTDLLLGNGYIVEAKFLYSSKYHELLKKDDLFWFYNDDDPYSTDKEEGTDNENESKKDAESEDVCNFYKNSSGCRRSRRLMNK